MSVLNCFQSLGEDVCLALTFFHCLTGPDSTCSFHNHTNDWYSGLKHWLMNDDLTKAFQQLSWRPTEQVLVNTESIIAEFVSYVYSKKVVDVDELRFDMFQASRSDELRNLLPSSDTLKLHVKPHADTNPPVDLWGWGLHQGLLHMLWTSEAPLKEDLELVTGICRCCTLKCQLRKCAINKVKCLSYCIWKRKCSNC